MLVPGIRLKKDWTVQRTGNPWKANTENTINLSFKSAVMILAETMNTQFNGLFLLPQIVAPPFDYIKQHTTNTLLIRFKERACAWILSLFYSLGWPSYFIIHVVKTELSVCYSPY